MNAIWKADGWFLNVYGAAIAKLVELKIGKVFDIFFLLFN